MHRINQLVPTGPTGFNVVKPTGPTGELKTKLTKSEVLGCDVALSQYTDLLQPRFFKWYCKVFYEIGRESFARCASEARADGRNPAKLFSYKLRQAMIEKQGGPAGGAPTGPTTNFNPNRKV